MESQIENEAAWQHEEIMPEGLWSPTGQDVSWLDDFAETFSLEAQCAWEAINLRGYEATKIFPESLRAPGPTLMFHTGFYRWAHYTRHSVDGQPVYYKRSSLKPVVLAPATLVSRWYRDHWDCHWQSRVSRREALLLLEQEKDNLMLEGREFLHWLDTNVGVDAIRESLADERYYKVSLCCTVGFRWANCGSTEACQRLRDEAPSRGGLWATPEDAEKLRIFGYTVEEAVYPETVGV